MLIKGRQDCRPARLPDGPAPRTKRQQITLGVILLLAVGIDAWSRRLGQ